MTKTDGMNGGITAIILTASEAELGASAVPRKLAAQFEDMESDAYAAERSWLKLRLLQFSEALLRLGDGILSQRMQWKNHGPFALTESELAILMAWLKPLQSSVYSEEIAEVCGSGLEAEWPSMARTFQNLHEKCGTPAGNAREEGEVHYPWRVIHCFWVSLTVDQLNDVLAGSVLFHGPRQRRVPKPRFDEDEQIVLDKVYWRLRALASAVRESHKDHYRIREPYSVKAIPIGMFRLEYRLLLEQLSWVAEEFKGMENHARDYADTDGHRVREVVGVLEHVQDGLLRVE